VPEESQAGGEPPVPASAPLPVDPIAALGDVPPHSGEAPSSFASPATTLVGRSLALARSGAVLDNPMAPGARRRLRHKHITSATKEPKYAAYMDNWVKKVERIGRLNFPEEARRARLTGRLVMDVVIEADGSVASIDVLKSSGHPELDTAAQRIVRLGEPYAPLPAEIRAETDVLHIKRSWQIRPGSRWQSD
jgi:protein TonB